jgi:hypothetical protein
MIKLYDICTYMNYQSQRGYMYTNLTYKLNVLINSFTHLFNKILFL